MSDSRSGAGKRKYRTVYARLRVKYGKGESKARMKKFRFNIKGQVPWGQGQDQGTGSVGGYGQCWYRV